MIKVVLLGAGNVASHLYRAFRETNAVNIIQVFSQTMESLDLINGKVEGTTDIRKLAEADIYLIAVPDDAIVSVSEKIDFSGKLVVHTSGSVGLTELSTANRRGVFYPLQTFSRDSIINYSNVPLCIEAENEEDLTLLQIIADTISDRVYKINSEQRRSLHLAAVFVNNFTNHMYHIGSEICGSNQIPFEILQPLIEETAAKIIKLTPEQAQTGPARRNDHSTIEKHLGMLHSEMYKEIYQLLTKSIQETYGRKKL